MSPICVPEKEKDFADENINSLGSFRESTAWQTLESSSVNSKEVSSGSHLSCYYWINRTSTQARSRGAAAPGSGGWVAVATLLALGLDPTLVTRG